MFFDEVRAASASSPATLFDFVYLNDGILVGLIVLRLMVSGRASRGTVAVSYRRIVSFLHRR